MGVWRAGTTTYIGGQHCKSLTRYNQLNAVKCQYHVVGRNEGSRCGLLQQVLAQQGNGRSLQSNRRKPERTSATQYAANVDYHQVTTHIKRRELKLRKFSPLMYNRYSHPQEIVTGTWCVCMAIMTNPHQQCIIHQCTCPSPPQQQEQQQHGSTDHSRVRYRRAVSELALETACPPEILRAHGLPGILGYVFVALALDCHPSVAAVDRSHVFGMIDA